jgi:hypothetical protein
MYGSAYRSKNRAKAHRIEGMAVESSESAAEASGRLVLVSEVPRVKVDSCDMVRSEIEGLVGVLEGSEGCKVEICTTDELSGSKIEIEVGGSVRFAGIECACEMSVLEGHLIAWYSLPWYAKVAGFMMLERGVNVLKTSETRTWSIGVLEVVEIFRKDVEGLGMIVGCIADVIEVVETVGSSYRAWSMRSSSSKAEICISASCEIIGVESEVEGLENEVFCVKSEGEAVEIEAGALEVLIYAETAVLMFELLVLCSECMLEVRRGIG